MCAMGGSWQQDSHVIPMHPLPQLIAHDVYAQLTNSVDIHALTPRA